MKTHDQIRSVADTLEAAGTAIESEGSQDDSGLDLGKLALGALDWATDTPSKFSKRFESLLAQYECQLKRLQPKVKARKSVSVAAAPSGDPW
jgi:hypothetical protein